MGEGAELLSVGQQSCTRQSGRRRCIGNKVTVAFDRIYRKDIRRIWRGLARAFRAGIGETLTCILGKVPRYPASWFDGEAVQDDCGTLQIEER